MPKDTASHVISQYSISPTKLEGPKACSWQKIKSNHEPSRCLPRDPEDNEMSLIRN
jgi:hypothetical protein